MLTSSDSPLCTAYDLAVLDLDGVVYVGPSAVDHAPEALARAVEQGMHLAFVTNNASRSPGAVAQHLSDLGVAADPADVVTSAQAAARLLAEQLPAGGRVYLMGGDGLAQALAEHDLVIVETVAEGEPDPDAVVQGYGPEMAWKRVVAGAVLVREGLPWVVSNTDSTIPTPRGVGPGHGTLVDLVSRFADRQPVVAGKPQPPLFEETRLRVGGERPLVVGDRVDTDIEGAVNVGWDSLLVMTGVTGLAELVAIEPRLRPSYVAADLRSLATAPTAPTRDGDAWQAEAWRAEVRDGTLAVEGSGGADAWWQVVAAAGWSHLDDTGQPVDTTAVTPPG